MLYDYPRFEQINIVDFLRKNLRGRNIAKKSTKGCHRLKKMKNS